MAQPLKPPITSSAPRPQNKEFVLDYGTHFKPWVVLSTRPGTLALSVTAPPTPTGGGIRGGHPEVGSLTPLSPVWTLGKLFGLSVPQCSLGSCPSGHSSKLHQTLKVWPLLVTGKPSLSGSSLSRPATATGCVTHGPRGSICNQRVACAVLEGERTSSKKKAEPL